MSKLCSSANSQEFPRVLVDFIGSELTALKVNKKLRIQAMLQSEEIMVKFKEHSTTDNITVTVKKSFGDPFIEIRMGGEFFDVKELVMNMCTTMQKNKPEQLNVLASRVGLL